MWINLHKVCKGVETRNEKKKKGVKTKSDYISSDDHDIKLKNFR